jgi:hypothetical protein
MSGKKKKEARKQAQAKPVRIHEATLASGPSGLVLRGAEIDLATAIAQRRAGKDVVVCGDDVKANANLARQIESAVGPYVQAPPHSKAGPRSLPHFQPDPRGHQVAVPRFSVPNRATDSARAERAIASRNHRCKRGVQVKLLTLTFLGLLVWSQNVVGDPLALQPLSMFRDGDFRPVGYALFALLAAIGTLPLLAHYHAGRLGNAGVFALGLGLLLVVAATPSLNPLHEAASILLLLLLFAYYAGALIAAQTNWLYLHMVVPILLMPLLSWGYGPWQKGLIVYLHTLRNVKEISSLIHIPRLRPVSPFFPLVAELIAMSRCHGVWLIAR